MENLRIIAVDENNLGKEDICCALADKKSRQGVENKTAWMSCRFREGLRFRKLNARGKVFIEYLPAEYAWKPIDAPGYMLIDCLWVSGQFKGHGWAGKLLDECIADSEGMNGVVVVTGNKKKPFLTDKSFFVKHGFETCDVAPPYFELLALKLKDAPLPRFRDSAKHPKVADQDGLVIVYTDQCPFTAFYVSEMISAAVDAGVPAKAIRMDTVESAKNAPSAFGTMGVFYNGEFVSHEIMSKPKMSKLLGALKK